MQAVVAWLSEPTAFVVPGRHVDFSRRLLQLGLSDDVAAFACAHEIAHLRLGHLRSWLSEMRRGLAP